MSKFKYGGRSEDTIKARQQQSGDFDSFLSDKAPKLKIPEGHMALRVLPYTWDKKLWGDNWALQVHIHRGVGPDNSSYLCPATMAKKYPKWKHADDDWCPICDAYAAEEDEKEKKKYRPQSQRLAYVINRKDEKAGPQIWRLGVKIETDLQMRSEDQKTGEMLLIDDPEEGYDISFRRVGTTMENTEYKAVDIDRSPSPIHEKESRQEAWLDFITENPIPDLLIFHDGKYLEKIFMGKGGSKKDKDDEEEDDRPTRARRSKADDDDGDDDRGRRRKPKEDEDDDDDDRSAGRRSRKAEAEDEEEGSTRRRPKKQADDDDDDDRSSRRKKAADDDDDDVRDRRRKKAADDDDDDDSSSRRRPKKAADDDDDDDRKPRRGRRDEQEEEDEERPTSSRARGAETKKPRSGGARSAGRDQTDDDDDDDRSSRRKKKPVDDDDDEIPFDKGKRRAPAKDDDDDDKDPPTARARKALEKMKGKARD